MRFSRARAATLDGAMVVCPFMEMVVAAEADVSTMVLEVTTVAAAVVVGITITTAATAITTTSLRGMGMGMVMGVDMVVGNNSSLLFLLRAGSRRSLLGFPGLGRVVRRRRRRGMCRLISRGITNRRRRTGMPCRRCRRRGLMVVVVGMGDKVKGVISRVGSMISIGLRDSMICIGLLREDKTGDGMGDGVVAVVVIGIIGIIGGKGGRCCVMSR